MIEPLTRNKMSNKQSKIHRHHFVFNPGDNGGEGLMVSTTFHFHEDGEMWIETELKLHSYLNSASLQIGSGCVTPEKLRQFANELDEATLKAKHEDEMARKMPLNP